MTTRNIVFHDYSKPQPTLCILTAGTREIGNSAAANEQGPFAKAFGKNSVQARSLL